METEIDPGIKFIGDALDAMKAEIAKNTAAVRATNPEAAASRMHQAATQSVADVAKSLAPMKVVIDAIAQTNDEMRANMRQVGAAGDLIGRWHWYIILLAVLGIWLIGIVSGIGIGFHIYPSPFVATGPGCAAVGGKWFPNNPTAPACVFFGS